MSEHNSPSENDGTSDPLPEENTLAWERQPGETDAAFAAFTRFRDLGASRTLILAYRYETGRKQVGQISGQWQGWHRDHRWKDRAAAYDAHLDKVARREAEAEHIQSRD